MDVLAIAWHLMPGWSLVVFAVHLLGIAAATLMAVRRTGKALRWAWLVVLNGAVTTSAVAMEIAPGPIAAIGFAVAGLLVLFTLMAAIPARRPETFLYVIAGAITIVPPYAGLSDTLSHDQNRLRADLLDYVAIRSRSPLADKAMDDLEATLEQFGQVPRAHLETMERSVLPVLTAQSIDDARERLRRAVTTVSESEALQLPLESDRLGLNADQQLKWARARPILVKLDGQ